MVLLLLPQERLLQDNPSQPSTRQGNGEPLNGRLGLTSLLIVLFLLVLFAKLCFGYRGWAFQDDDDDEDNRTAPMVDEDENDDDDDCDDDIDCKDSGFEKKRDDENDNDGNDDDEASGKKWVQIKWGQISIGRGLKDELTFNKNGQMSDIVWKKV